MAAIALPDSHYLNYIEESKLLSEVSVTKYLFRMNQIQKDIMDNEPIQMILQNPEMFDASLKTYGATHGRLHKEMSPHTLNSYYIPIMYILKVCLTIGELSTELYSRWENLANISKKEASKVYLTNAPTDRQSRAYMSYDELCDIRDHQKLGSPERLLMSMYLDIPPVRSDYYATRLYDHFVSDDETRDNENYILMDKSMLVLKKYKTAAKYGHVYIELPGTLMNEIRESLRIIPRHYLFGTPTVPYTSGNFNRWANRCLKVLTGKPDFCLTMFRHIYVSRPELELTELSGDERSKLSLLMGHSVEQQQKYMWHSWLKTHERDITPKSKEAASTTGGAASTSNGAADVDDSDLLL